MFGRMRGGRADRGDLDGAVADGLAASGDADEVAIVEIDDASFLAETARGYTVVDFWATWCGPCHAFSPVFEAMARRRTTESLRFARCDVDASPGAAGLLQIRSVPTVVLFDPDGNEAGRVAGIPAPKQLDRLLALAR